MPTTDIGCEWTLVAAPTQEPLDLDELNDHARITGTANDGVMKAYLTAAREEAEQYMGRGLLTQTWKLVLDSFANIIPLPMAAPLQNDATANPSTAPVVKYYDTDGTLQTLATTVYDVDTVSRPGRIVLKPAQSWPSLKSERRNGRVEITYVVGWTTPADVPERIKQGIRMYATFLDLDRDGIEVRALDARMAAERCWSDRIYWTAPEY